ncbi:MAG: hypothetical protein R6U70_05275 [Bacillota bacterium]
MKRRGVILYDVYFPIWVQLLVPRILASVLIVNYMVNALVVTAALRAMSVTHTLRGLLRYTGWATLFGIMADFAGLFLYDLLLRGGHPIASAVNPLLFSIIAIAAPIIFAANLILAQRLLGLSPGRGVVLGAIMAILTSPWLVLLDRTHLM